MRDKELLPEAGKFYKGNLHSHTIVSDGIMTPEQSKRAYKDQRNGGGHTVQQDGTGHK